MGSDNGDKQRHAARARGLFSPSVQISPLALAIVCAAMVWLGRASGFFLPSPQAQLEEIFYKGTWKAVDLSEYDRMAAAQDAAMPEIQEGHCGQLLAERQAYVALASMPFVKRICEIGFNGGHSAGLWLRAAPNAEVIMFDLWNHTYNEKGENFLRDPKNWEKYGLKNNPDERLTIIKGSSLRTVPQFAYDHTETKCDILSIDGGHSLEIASADIWAMKNLANRDFHVVLLDDTNCDGFWCVGPKAALEKAMSLGLVRYVAGLTERDDAGRGFTILQYK